MALHTQSYVNFHSSDRELTKGFERGSIVVGSAVPDFQRKGLRQYLMMMTEYHNMRNAISRAVVDELYYAPQSNYGFTKEF